MTRVKTTQPNLTGVDHRVGRGNNGRRLQSDRSYYCGCREPAIVDLPCKLGRTRRPDIDMECHWKVRDWRRIPDRASMDQMIVNQPADLARIPFNCEAVACFGCVKPEFNIACSTSIAIVKVCSFATWVVEDIYQEAVWSIPCDLDVYFLSW